MMLGFLLARAGVDVVVLEKHADFLRDFRGDTIHPSTLELMHELGLLDEFLERPASGGRAARRRSSARRRSRSRDFSHLPTRCKFIALMPQWDFLDFLADAGEDAIRRFRLRMRAEVTGPDRGARAASSACAPRTPDGPLEVRADLVVGATAAIRPCATRAGLAVEDLGAPMDVLWMRVSRRAGRSGAALGRFDRGRIFVHDQPRRLLAVRAS